jgi:hypothetical protein
MRKVSISIDVPTLPEAIRFCRAAFGCVVFCSDSFRSWSQTSPELWLQRHTALQVAERRAARWGRYMRQEC